MKTCKDNIFFEAKTAGEYPKNWMVVSALDVGRYIKENYVPLSEFEAYKNKVKQAIEKVFKEEQNNLFKQGLIVCPSGTKPTFEQTTKSLICAGIKAQIFLLEVKLKKELLELD